MESGESEEIPCGGVVPDTTGQVRLECFQGLVTASHSCGRRCAGGAVVAAVGVAPSNGSAALRVPEAGLDHGAWSTSACGLHFEGTSGSLGLLCLRGQPQVFGQCLPVPEEEAVMECPDEIIVGMGILGSVGLVALCVGISACAYMLYRSRQVEPVVPLSRLEAIVPAPPPPPPPVVHRVVTVEQQTMSKICEVGEAQTLPQVYAELVRGRQMPLDMVCCVDSGYSVGEDGFGKSISFLESVVQCLEMPPVQVGVVQFNHGLAVTSELTPSAPALLQCLGDMTYQLGGKKLGPPLQKACDMLRASGNRALACHGDVNRKKAVLVLTDGETNDLPEAAQAVSALKHQGVVVMFVLVGEQVSPVPPHPVMMMASEPPESHIVNLRSYGDLPGACERVLERLVDVAMWVRRAKCVVDLPGYQEVADIDCVPGYEIMVPGWQPKDSYQWAWEPEHGRCLQAPEVIPWDRSYTPCGPAPLPPPAPDAYTQTDLVLPPPVLEGGVQTDPVVKVSLDASRQAPLDLVICVDSSVSITSARQAHSGSLRPGCGNPGCGNPVDSAAFERARGFVDYLASCVHMPEVRLALVFFNEASRVLRALTGDRDEFLSGLQEIEPIASETRLGPPLRHALALLSSRRDVGPAPVAQAVLVITDGGHIDQEDAKQSSSALQDLGAQLVFVKTGKASARVDSAALRTLAAPGPRLPRIGRCPSELPQAPRGLFECEDDAQALRQLVPDVLGQLLAVTQQISRARCIIPLEPYEVVQGDLSSIEGQDILPSEGQPPSRDHGIVAWEPWMMPEPAPEPTCMASPVQTDPVLQVDLTPWRHAPLDLVVCLDNSASFGLERQALDGQGSDAGTYIQSKTFARAKAFLESLASAVHMPEVRLALLRLEDAPEAVCGLTGSSEDFKTSLQGIEPSASHTAFAPPLRYALRMLETSRGEIAAANGTQEVDKAVLVLTDSDPSDIEETMQAAARLQERGSRLLFVKILKDGGSPRLLPAGARSPEVRLDQEPPWGVLQAVDSQQALQQLLPEVLRQLVQVTQRIRRAWCTLPVQALAQGSLCGGLNGFGGHEVRLPEDLPVLVPERVPWDPAHNQDPTLIPELPAYYQQEVDASRLEAADLRRQIEEARLEVQRVNEVLEKREQERLRVDDERRALDEERRKAEEERRAAAADHLQTVMERHEEEKRAAEAERNAVEAERRAADAEYLRTIVVRHEEERRVAEEAWKEAGEERRAADDRRYQDIKQQLDDTRGRAEEAEARVLEYKRHVEGRDASDEERRVAEEERRAAEEERRRSEEERRAAEEARVLDLQTKLVEVTRQAEEAEAKARDWKKRVEEAEREKESKVREASRRVREMEGKMSDLTRTVSQLRAELSNREAQDSLREAELRAKASEFRAQQATAERKAEVLQLRLEQAELEVKTLRSGSTEWRVDGKVRTPNLDRSLQVAEGALDVARSHGNDLQDHAHAIENAVDGLSHILAKALTSRSNSPRANSREPLRDTSPGAAAKRSGSRERRSLIWRSTDLGECMEWVRTKLEERAGGIDQAFNLFDTNKTGRITCGETIAALELHLGLSRSMATHVFRRLLQLARCERRGCLTKQDWVSSFMQVRASTELAMAPPGPGLATLTSSTTSAREASSTMLQLEGREEDTIQEISC